MKKLWIAAALCLLLITQNTIAQSSDKKLEKQLVEMVAGFRGVAGIYVKHLPTGKTISISGDSLFPTASMVKIPILIGIMDKINKGELDIHQSLEYRDSLLYEGEDILGSFKDSQQIVLNKVLMLMMSTSDNTASLWMQQLAGTGTRINSILDSLGYRQTRVNSRTEGRKENWKEFGWGQTSPKDMVNLFEQIYRRKMLDSASSIKMLQLMGRNYWDEEALSQIPPDIFVASKNGAVDASRSETMLVMAPTGPYIFSLITKNQLDQRWDSDNEGWVLARKISLHLWRYFVPKSSWKPLMPVTGNPATQRND